MEIENLIKAELVKAIEELYGTTVEEKSIQLQLTRKDMNGDFTVVVFPLLKIST